MSLKSELAKISKPYIRKSEMVKDKNGKLHEIKAYDNLGKSADRYCVYFMADKNTRNGMTGLVAMDAAPFYPTGIGMSSEGYPGPHNGKRIRLSELPTDCQRLVMNNINNEY